MMMMMIIILILNLIIVVVFVNSTIDTVTAGGVVGTSYLHNRLLIFSKFRQSETVSLLFTLSIYPQYKHFSQKLCHGHLHF